MTANESDWRMWRLKDQYESGINLWNSWVINVPAVSCRPLQAVGTNGTILSAGTLFWQCLLPICKCRIPTTSFVSSYMFIGIWLLGCGHGLPICLVFFFSGNCRIIYMSVHIYSCQMVLPLHGNLYASTLSGLFLVPLWYHCHFNQTSEWIGVLPVVTRNPHPYMECV